MSGDERPTDIPRTPWRAFVQGTTVAIFDAHDREIIKWTGFDGSAVTAWEDRAALAERIVLAVNADCAPSAGGEPSAMIETWEALKAAAGIETIRDPKLECNIVIDEDGQAWTGCCAARVVNMEAVRAGASAGGEPSAGFPAELAMMEGEAVPGSTLHTSAGSAGTTGGDVAEALKKIEAVRGYWPRPNGPAHPTDNELADAISVIRAALRTRCDPSQAVHKGAVGYAPYIGNLVAVPDGWAIGDTVEVVRTGRIFTLPGIPGLARAASQETCAHEVEHIGDYANTEGMMGVCRKCGKRWNAASQEGPIPSPAEPTEGGR